MKATRSLARHVMHQSAVKLINTALFDLLKSDKRSAEYTSHNGGFESSEIDITGAERAATRQAIDSPLASVNGDLVPIAALLSRLSQRAIDIKMMPKITTAATSVLVCLPTTQSNHKAVKNKGKAKNCLKVSIQGPGFGSLEERLGNHVRAMKGSAIPNPRNAKTSNATYIGCEMANPSAGPINGAVHGLATVVANTPVKNDDESESDGSEDWPNDIMLVPISR